MDRALWTLALAAPVGVLIAGRVPGLAPVASLVLAGASLGWAIQRGPRAWAFAMLPGAFIVGIVAPGAAAPTVATLLVGPLAARALAMGAGPLMALAVGALPFAVWTGALLVSGFDPFPPEARETMDRFLNDALGRGQLTAEQAAQWRASSEAAVAILTRTWVATEVIAFWVTLVVAYALVRRLMGGLPPFRRWTAMTLPDFVVGVLISGLALVLIGGTVGMTGATTVGWNLVLAAAVAFLLCGVGIELHWMERARLARLAKLGIFVVGVLLFLPAYLAMTTGLGLFDTWFDFRRLRTGERGQSPLSPFPRSSDDDRRER